MFADNKQQTGRILGKIYPSEDIQADLFSIQAIYAAQGIEVVLPTAKSA